MWRQLVEKVYNKITIYSGKTLAMLDENASPTGLDVTQRQATWLVVTDVRSESFRLVIENRHYNRRHRGRLLSSSSVVSCNFSVICLYSKVGHHAHPPGYLCAKFCFFCKLHCWTRTWRKITYSITQSLTQLIWCPGNRSFRFGIKHRRINTEYDKIIIDKSTDNIQIN